MAMITRYVRASHGVAASMPSSLIRPDAIRVSVSPPTDSPVEATDNASARRRWNQRVSTVVVGTRPPAAKPAPKNT